MTEPVFPAPGHSYRADFGELAFRLNFHHDGKAMTFSPLGENAGNDSQTIDYTAVPIRDQVFLVYWTEADGTTVTHVEDFERELVHTNITGPDGTFVNLTGKLTKVQ